MDELDERARRVAALSDAVVEVLKPFPPLAIGGALSNLTSRWLVGFGRKLREELLAEHLTDLRPFIRVNRGLHDADSISRRLAPEDEARLIGTISEVVGRMFAGVPGEIVALVLVDLVARDLASYPPKLREALIEQHVRAVRTLIPVSELLLWRGACHPDDRH